MRRRRPAVAAYFITTPNGGLALDRIDPSFWGWSLRMPTRPRQSPSRLNIASLSPRSPSWPVSQGPACPPPATFTCGGATEPRTAGSSAPGPPTPSVRRPQPHRGCQRLPRGVTLCLAYRLRVFPPGPPDCRFFRGGRLDWPEPAIQRRLTGRYTLRAAKPAFYFGRRRGGPCPPQPQAAAPGHWAGPAPLLCGSIAWPKPLVGGRARPTPCIGCPLGDIESAASAAF